jgi:hypothetical protein
MYIAAIRRPSPATGFPNAAAVNGLTAPLTWVPESERPSQSR